MKIAILLIFFNWLLCIRSRKWDRFEIFWNIPSWNCYRRNISMPLREYGIRVNEKHNFYGDQIVTFYEHKIGLYPYFRNHSDPNSAVNGGIPQRVNMKAHLLKIRQDIEAAIPNSGFDGLAIFDFESWRPLWSLNWGSKRIYKTASVSYIKQLHPHLSNKSARKMASTAFNEAAMTFLTETIRLASYMRPYAHWGFYGMPYCNYNAGQNDVIECDEQFRNFNDRLQFLYRESSALYPSIYLRSETKGSENYRYIQAVLREAKRCKDNLKQIKPIFAFTSIEYQPYTDPTYYYSKRDLCNSLKQSSDLGLQGAIIWSTSNGMNKERCGKLAIYIVERLGQYVKILKNFADRCSDKKCNGNGQCILLSNQQSYCSTNNDLTEYDCLCDANFDGPSCSWHRYFPWLYTKTRSKFTTEEPIKN